MSHSGTRRRKERNAVLFVENRATIGYGRVMDEKAYSMVAEPETAVVRRPTLEEIMAAQDLRPLAVEEKEAVCA